MAHMYLSEKTAESSRIWMNKICALRWQRVTFWHSEESKSILLMRAAVNRSTFHPIFLSVCPRAVGGGWNWYGWAHSQITQHVHLLTSLMMTEPQQFDAFSERFRQSALCTMRECKQDRTKWRTELIQAGLFINCAWFKLHYTLMLERNVILRYRTD